MSISGTTRVAGVIGDPVRHSRSPVMFNAAFAACGLDWVYVALPTPLGFGADAVRAMPVLGISGLNVTMPHKRDAATACTTLSATARALGVVNTCVLRNDGSVLGDSTDGSGLLGALGDEGVAVADHSVCIVGAGGAARSAAYALGAEGATVTVAARDPDAAAEVALLVPAGRSLPLSELSGELPEFDLIVNATPVGMQGEPPLVDVRLLHSDAFVYDMVYGPRPTPLVAAATEAGLRVSNGLGMLVHQAALAFERFTGQDAPLAEMARAATVPA